MPRPHHALARRRSAQVVAVLAALAALVGAPAAAQDEVGGIRVGGFRIRPTATVSVARDSNVNADPSELGDWKSFTSLDVIARTQAGVLDLQSRSVFETLYFNTLTGMRNVGWRQEARADFDLDRFRPFVLQSVAKAISPFSIEINVPLERFTLGTSAGSDVRLSTLTRLRGEVIRQSSAFPDEVVFRDRTLSGPLNQVQTTGQVSLLHALTPKTTLSFAGALQRSDFEKEPLRNTTGYQFGATVNLQKSALISGSASIGRRHQDFTETGQAAFDGLVAAVDLSYVLGDATRFTARAGRDASNTLDAVLPYFILTTLNGSITHQFRGQWEVKGAIQRDQLDYRADGRPVPTDAPAAFTPRTDSARQYTFGILRRFNRRLSATFDVQKHVHESPLPRFQYQRLAVGSGFIYAF